jgi:hypothetical protein
MSPNAGIASHALTFKIGYDLGSDREIGLVTDGGVVVIPANTYVGPPQTFAAPHVRWKTELIKKDRTKSPQREGERA